MHRWFTRVQLRMRSLFRGAAVDVSMRSELQVHLAEQIDEYISGGMTRDEAREAALRDFGSLTRIEEECRDARRVNFISNLAQDLRYTFRSLRAPAAAGPRRHDLDRRRGRREHHDLQPGLRAAVCHAVGEGCRPARAHSDQRQQPRVLRSMAGARRESRPEWSGGLSDRSRGELARARELGEPDSAHRHLELLRRPRNVGRDGSHLYGRRSGRRARTRTSP